jgi:hypothetical protein
MTLSAPGTGLSFVQPLGAGTSPSISAPPASPTPPGEYSLPVGGNMQEIRSSGSATLTTAGLAAFKESLLQADRQFETITSELDEASGAADKHVAHHQKWANGWLFRRVLKKRFAAIAALAEESVARREELREQLRQSTLKTDFEMPDGVAKAFDRLCESFQNCTRSQRIWDNVAQRAANRVVERTTAARIVDLKPVSFKMGRCKVIDTDHAVPHLENANGGDIYFYPGFLVYHAAATNYALIEYHELDLGVMATEFQEEKAVPSDAQQVGTTWAKANKDGSPDRRFANNYQIPVMLYARLTLQTAAGLNEEYMLSDFEASRRFGAAWTDMVQATKLGH